MIATKFKIRHGMLLAALTLAAGTALADGNALTANLGFTSDYTFRGISQNYRAPAFQGGFDYTLENGFSMGTWASNISGNQYTNASQEWDVYGGYTGKLDADASYSLGLNYAMYPGGRTSTTSPSRNWDTTEASAGLTYKIVNFKYTYALTDWYGISSASRGGFEPVLRTNGATTADAGSDLRSKGSYYIEANLSQPLGDDYTLALHAGHQTIKNFHLLSYTDYKIGLSRPLGGFTIAANYTRTNASDNSLYHVAANGQDKNLRGSILALSINRSY